MVNFLYYLFLVIALCAAIGILMLWNKTLKRALSRQADQLNAHEEALALTLNEVGHARSMLQKVLDTVPVRVFWKDRSGKYLGCNIAFAKDAGLSCVADIIGKDDFGLAWVEQAELYRSDDFAVMEAGTARYNYEEPQVVNGVIRTLKTSKIPLTDEGGHLIGILGIYEDITELKRTEFRLKRVNAMLRSVRNIGQLIIQEKDPHRLIQVAVDILARKTVFLQAWIILYDKAGNYLASAAAPPTSTSTNLIERVMNAGNTPVCLVAGDQKMEKDFKPSCSMCPCNLERDQEIFICRPLIVEQSRFGVVAVIADPLTFDEEERVLFDEVCGDLAFALRGIELDQERVGAVEALIAAKEMAESASKAKDEFLAMMSHEMRTPLNPIMGFAHLMRVADPGEPNRTYLDTIMNAAQRQLGLIDNILNFTRLDRGTLEPKYSEFNLLDVCDCALRDIESVAHGLELKFVNGGVHQPIELNSVFKGEQSMLMQLLDNLLNNACKYTEEGSITLMVGQDDSPWINFSVIDTGIGIESSMKDRLFYPFTQIDCTYSRKHEGIGMGLAICRKLVDVLNGQIGVDSEPGKGSCFWFRLPMRLVGRDDPGGARDLTGLKQLNKALHVLVVEDNQTNMLLMERLIIAFGGRVLVAKNGLQALALCEKVKFDAILMDLAMPGMNGVDAYKKIRQNNSKNFDTPVIALTADLVNSIRKECVELGMFGYLTKPIHFDELFKLLNKI